MSTGTITPTPFQTVEGYDPITGLWGPIAGCLIYTYDAGTMDPATTYANVALSSANTNPIEADASGRWSAFLVPGNSYKFYYCYPVTPIPDPSAPPSAFRTADNIAATPQSSQSLDITGTFGETVSEGDCVYLSDGSGGKTTGRWYLASSANAYSSVVPEIGFAVADTNLGDEGAIRQAGQVDQGSVSAGSTYYVGTAGAITATAPDFARIVGQADTANSIVASCAATLIAAVDNRVCDGRLSLTSGTPVTNTDVTAATTIYFTPYAGNRIAFYDGTRWVQRTFSEISIAVPATTVQMYDIWVYDSTGTLTLELTAWTNDTTRATALANQNGVLVKSGTVTRRYVGSFRTTGVSGQTEDSLVKRYLWNYYNRVQRPMKVIETTNTWTWATASWHQANAAAGNQLDFVVGVNEAPVTAQAVGLATQNAVGAANMAVAIGLDSTTVPSGIWTVVCTWDNGGQPGAAVAIGMFCEYPGVGRHVLVWLEFGNTNTLTYYGDASPPATSGGSPTPQTGISGSLFG
jgi:hypothetical protein